MELFFQDKTQRELIELYVITGGIPMYIELFVADTNLYAAIQHNVLSTSSYLYDEPIFLLQQEVNEVCTYISVIKAIAAGNSKLSAIAVAMEVKQTSLSKYLKTLIDLDILKREVPITVESPVKWDVIESKITICVFGLPIFIRIIVILKVGIAIL